MSTSPAIQWQESDDVYRPRKRPLNDFLGSVHVCDVIGARNELGVYINRDALETMLSDARQDLRLERGGVLIGESFEDENGSHYVVLLRAVPAVGAQGTPTFLEFTAESWRGISAQLPLNDDEVIHGWYHTHPGLGVFMSGTDRRTQGLLFNKPWHIAVVIDPRANEIGFFAGADSAPVSSVRVYHSLNGAGAVTGPVPVFAEVRSRRPASIAERKRKAATGIREEIVLLLLIALFAVIVYYDERVVRGWEYLFRRMFTWIGGFFR